MAGARDKWSDLVRDLRAVAEALTLIARIPLGGILRGARRVFAAWPIVEPVVDSRFDAAGRTDLRGQFRKLSAQAGLMLERERRVFLIAYLSAFTVGMAVAVVAWLWLLAQLPDPDAAGFAVASAALFALNGVGALPGRATTRPWWVLGSLALVWLAFAVLLVPVTGGSWVEMTTNWRNGHTSPAETLFAAAVAIAVFDVLGAVLAYLALSMGWWTIRRRRHSQYVVTMPIYVLALLVVRLGDPKTPQSPEFQRWVIGALRFLEPLIGQALPKRIGVAGGYSAARRFSDAAQALRGYETWIALPQRDTRLDLRDALADLLVTMLSGQYHFLPCAEAVHEPAAARRVRILSAVRQFAVAVLPLAAVVLWSVFGFGFPDPIKEWLSGLAVLWLLAALLAMLDPAYGSTLSTVRGLLQRRE